MQLVLVFFLCGQVSEHYKLKQASYVSKIIFTVSFTRSKKSFLILGLVILTGNYTEFLLSSTTAALVLFINFIYI